MYTVETHNLIILNLYVSLNSELHQPDFLAGFLFKFALW